MLAPILFYLDSWGDHVAVSLTRDSLGRWVVTSRFGDARAYRRFWRWRPATYAYDEEVDNAELLVAAIGNGIPVRTDFEPPG